MSWMPIFSDFWLGEIFRRLPCGFQCFEIDAFAFGSGGGVAAKNSEFSKGICDDATAPTFRRLPNGNQINGHVIITFGARKENLSGSAAGDLQL